jgi:hypothetical protein
MPERFDSSSEYIERSRALAAYEAELENSGPKGSWRQDISRYNERAGEALPVSETDPEKRCRILIDRRQDLEASDEEPSLKELKLSILEKLSIFYTTQFEKRYENDNYES